ncbi:protein FAM47E [Pristis pectinata]|uniref:protein FAM47E n=1 Tax=Pristis pectinata TaxID=685728 RepID=UPI00223CC728|nr:protein FAM47E [Pristis pectinata]
MAHKYDTLLAEKSALSKIIADKNPLPQPWYKERLKTKYLKKNPKLLSDALNGHRWRFLKSGLDDFRDGYPPQSQEDLAIIQSQKGSGLSPLLVNVTETFKPAQRVSKRLTKSQICYSKALPLQQAKREQIEEIEYGLSQHPLALYPHLEEGVPPELFENIVDILDPEMLLTSEEAQIAPMEPTEVNKKLQKPQKRKEMHRQKCSESSEEKKIRNPYKWILTRGAQKEDKKAKLKGDTPSRQDKEIEQVTKAFCDWVASLGGKNNNIEEATVMSLFASDYESHSALAIPIHVMELIDIPPELRKTVGTPSPPPSVKISKTVGTESTQQHGYKFKYGAWYLDPKTWVKRRADEPLVDPNFVPEADNSYLPEGDSEKDEELRRLHAILSFKKFIEVKGLRKPEFMKKLFDTVDENGKIIS